MATRSPDSNAKSGGPSGNWRNSTCVLFVPLARLDSGFGHRGFPCPFSERASSPCYAGNDHVRINHLAPLDNDFVVEHDGAVPHRDVIVSARIAFPSTLRIGAGREQEVPRKGPRCCAMSFRLVPMQGNPVPPRMRIQPPTQMRDSVGVAIVRVAFVVR